MSSLNGSCHCGAVKYTVSGPIRRVVNCHCQLCRKINGSAFSTYVAVLESDFELQQGELLTYSVTDNASKSFCGRCGTPVFNTNAKYGDVRILHLGSLDEPGDIDPDVNIYCESQMNWVEQLADLPNLEQGPK